MSSQAGGRALVRKVTAEPARFRKRAKVVPVSRRIRSMGTPGGVHQFRRVVSGNYNITSAGINLGGSIAQGFAVSFNLQGPVLGNSVGGSVVLPIPQYAELAALFDMVKLEKVIIRFRSKNDSAPVATNGNQALEIATAYDFNDVTSPSVITDIQQYSSFKSDIIEPGGKEHNRALKPQWLQLVGYTALLSGYASKTGYVKSDYDIPHYGMKGWIVGGTTNNTTMNIEIEYLYSCKFTK